MYTKCSSAKTYYTFIDQLIQDVKKRPMLWEKRIQRRTHRNKVAREWEYLGKLYNKQPLEVKSKWRNIKDTFNREAKKMNVPPLGKRDKPLIEYYEGQWQNFEKLLFLWDEKKHMMAVDDENIQDQQEFIEVEENNTKVKNNIKHETCDSENETDDEDGTADYNDSTVETDNMPIQSLFNRDTPDPIGNEVDNLRKRQFQHEDTETITIKRKQSDPNQNEKCDSDLDEDLHFAKSLVPFMRKLNPIRKLIVRNEIHSLLLNELLCNRCKSTGPQQNCQCNLK
ncbi:unnamed protein product [Diatraea saccharalis]|uniref:MADF domain-containing protein n=1 Tax=Diatraea saccharalis TaxID=40085 RepID=A0A9N9WEZ5_9NEOP|nr:unnamed protein product [Diatraea saccharalis]